MITTLLTESGLVGMHVDNVRSLVWLARDDGLVLSTDLTGNATKHQELPGTPVDIAGSKTVVAAVLDDGTAWTLDPDDPATAATQVATFAGTPSQVAVSRTGTTILAAIGGSGFVATIATGTLASFGLPVGTSGVAVLATRLAAAANDPGTGVSRLRRLGGFWLADRFERSPLIDAMLTLLPVAILISIVAPAMVREGINGAIATGVAVLVMRRTGSVLLTLMIGVGVIWLLREVR